MVWSRRGIMIASPVYDGVYFVFVRTSLVYVLFGKLIVLL
jgi:hypothetical protein